MTQKSAPPSPRIFAARLRRGRYTFADRHAPEMAAVDVGNAVVPGKSFVEERVVRPDQIHHAAIFADDAVDKELSFFPETFAHVVVEFGEPACARHERIEVAQPQPLTRKIRRQILRPWIRKHPASLLLELFGPAQPAANRRIEQLIVWNAAPQKKG